MTHVASFTLSFARQARGHTATSSVQDADTGVQLADLERIAGVLRGRGIECEITRMSCAGEDAYLLHAKSAFDPSAAEAELQSVQFPTQELLKGEVKNLKKRLNAQIADFSQEADPSQKRTRSSTGTPCRLAAPYGTPSRRSRASPSSTATSWRTLWHRKAGARPAASAGTETRSAPSSLASASAP